MSHRRARLAVGMVQALESRTLLSAAPPAAMGFLPDYQIGNSNPVFYENGSGTITVDKMDWKALKQVNYFALLPNSDGTLQADTSSGYHPEDQLPLLVKDATSHNVKVYVTVGGGDSGTSIPAMNSLVGSNQAAWTKFAGQIKAFCVKYGLAGIDLDWEPTSTSAAMIKNFGTLVQTIKADDPSLKLTADVDGDPIPVSGVASGQGRTLDAVAIKYLDAVNVMAYYETPSEAIASMTAWKSYLAGGKDATGATVAGRAAQLQFGMEVDGTTSPKNIVEQKVDNAIKNGYGGLFIWTLTEDTAASSLISRVSAEVIKDTTITTHKLSGTIIAAAASKNSSLANAFDGNLATAYKSTNKSGNWIGLDLGAVHKLTQIKFASSKAAPYYMEGGVFQASNSATFSSGVVNLYTVPNTSAPSATTLTTINVTGSYRYVRYVAPAASYSEVSEVEFFGV